MNYETLPQYWVNHLSFQLRKQLETVFASLGHRVTAEEWSLLLILNQNETLSPSDLSRLTLRDTTTISRLIDRLERKTLIARSRTRADRRIVDIQMTEAGRALFAELADIAGRIIARSLDGLSASEIEQTIHVLQKMSENLSAVERTADV